MAAALAAVARLGVPFCRRLAVHPGRDLSAFATPSLLCGIMIPQKGLPLASLFYHYLAIGQFRTGAPKTFRELRFERGFRNTLICCGRRGTSRRRASPSDEVIKSTEFGG